MTGSPATGWILRIQRWAEGDPNVRLALLVGSQARREMPADPLSDIDIAVFASDPDVLLHDEGWIAGLGPYWTSHLESNGLRLGEERRVLFVDGQDVDFAVFPAGVLVALLTDPRATEVLRRGFRPLVNKDAIELAAPSLEPTPPRPSAAEFSNLVNDFWFHLVWTAKKVRRGELLTAVEATNGYLRALLVRMVRWHALVRGPTGRDVWHGTRFFESWADPRVIRDLPQTIARYDATAVARALRAYRALFSWLTEEVAQGSGFPSPIPGQAALSMYLDALLEEPRERASLRR